MFAGSPFTSRQIEVNGASLHVQEHGQGDGIVLAHMGLASSVTWGGVLPLLTDQFRVVTFDTRGHGHSSNPGGELSYEIIADDVAELIRTLDLKRPFVGGWSDGGEVALQLGLRHPGLARGLIVGGTCLELGSESVKAKMRAFFNADAVGVVDFDAFSAGTGQELLPMMRQWHPNGEGHVRSIVQHSATMWLNYAGFTQEKIERIEAPALVVVGDRDEQIPVEEAVRLFRWLPNAELAILPGASHLRPIFEPATIVRSMLDFIQRH